jgi:sulfur carrier protein
MLEFSVLQRPRHPVIALTINGESRRFDAPLKVDALLRELDLTGKRVALECNGEIVPRSRFSESWLADGDRVEIVVAVGGG